MFTVSSVIYVPIRINFLFRLSPQLSAWNSPFLGGFRVKTEKIFRFRRLSIQYKPTIPATTFLHLVLFKTSSNTLLKAQQIRYTSRPPQRPYSLPLLSLAFLF